MDLITLLNTCYILDTVLLDTEESAGNQRDNNPHPHWAYILIGRRGRQ